MCNDCKLGVIWRKSGNGLPEIAGYCHCEEGREKLMRKMLRLPEFDANPLNHEATERMAERENADRLATALHRVEMLLSRMPAMPIMEVLAEDRLIEAFGLNPWCVNEGLAPSDATVDIAGSTLHDMVCDALRLHDERRAAR